MKFIDSKNDGMSTSNFDPGRSFQILSKEFYSSMRALHTHDLHKKRII
jgi:hypothetical protein